MSYSNKVASKDSITNQNQGGGTKKAGSPHGIGKDYHFKSFARPIGPLSFWRIQSASQMNASQRANIGVIGGINFWR